nr:MULTISPECIES: phosphomannomutase [Neokomagataea]
MVQSSVPFGTSGARGLVSDMTDAVCFAYTVGYLKHLETLGEFSPGTSVAIAGDLRPSTPRILEACSAAILWMKGLPLTCGYVPTPALSLYAFSRKIPSLMVTGSHIPDDRNGIKFNRAQGEFLKDDETAMREHHVSLPSGWFDGAGNLTHTAGQPMSVNVVDEYVNRYRDFFGTSSLSGLTLGVYQHSAVGRDILVSIVEALGGTAIPLERSDKFVSVDTEAVRPEDVTLAQGWAKSGLYDAILTTDGDSDRPLLADQNGRWLRGDILGIIASKALGASAVTTPVSSNTALEALNSIHSIRRTKIGSPYVVVAMNEAVAEGCVPSVGYEANGGFLLASDIVRNGRTLTALPTRDAVLPMLCALDASLKHKEGLSGLLTTLPARFTVSDRLKDIPTALSQKKLKEFRVDIINSAEEIGFNTISGSVKNINEIDGLRLTFDSDDVIHLRPSGNAPELRIYVESHTQAQADLVLSESLKKVAHWINQ